MIDIHTHILPKIDDGAQSLEETYHMIEEAQKAGFTDIIATSHYIENQYEVDTIKRRALIEAINRVIAQKELNIKLHMGNEIYITPNLAQLVKQKKVATLADSRYVLFELPMNSKINYLEKIIFEIQANGLVPIIAHPERYQYVQENPNFVVNLVTKGVLFQANFASIGGYYGKKAKKALIQLLKANSIHFFAVDAHNFEKYDIIQENIKELEKIISKEQLERLTTIHPSHILENTKIEIEPPKLIKRGLFY